MVYARYEHKHHMRSAISAGVNDLMLKFMLGEAIGFCMSPSFLPQEGLLWTRCFVTRMRILM